jgi:hypothetical protein
VYCEFFPQEQTANRQYCMQENVGRKRLGNGSLGGWFLHHDIAAPQSAFCVREFVTQNKVNVLHLCLPNVAPCDISLVPKVNMALKRG